MEGGKSFGTPTGGVSKVLPPSLNYILSTSIGIIITLDPRKNSSSFLSSIKPRLKEKVVIVCYTFRDQIEENKSVDLDDFTCVKVVEVWVSNVNCFGLIGKKNRNVVQPDPRKAET